MLYSRYPGKDFFSFPRLWPLDAVRHLETEELSDPPTESPHTFSHSDRRLTFSRYLGGSLPGAFVACSSDQCRRTPLDSHCFGPRVFRDDLLALLGHILGLHCRAFFFSQLIFFAILLTFLSTPDCPDQTGTLHTPLFALFWRLAYRHVVTLSSFSRRSIRLQCTLCLPSSAEIQGCVAY